MLATTYAELSASIRSERTAHQYRGALRRYLAYRKQEELSELLEGHTKTIESDIIAYLVYLKQKKISWSSRNGELSALKHFYKMNDVTLNWYKIGRYLGEYNRVVHDRAYTTEEIQQLLTKADERMRVVILLLASSGMRIGAIPDLKLRQLKKVENYHLYQIVVYENSNDEYYCFCSPECAEAIRSYLAYRERYGEKLKPDAPLIREMFNTQDPLKCRIPKMVGLYTLSDVLQKLLVRSGINTIAKQTETTQKGKERKGVARAHGFRKFATTNMIRAKVDPQAREMLLGHSIGLANSYYRPNSDEILDEYLKAVDLLTINEENRLKKKVELLTIRADQLEQLQDQMDEVKSKLGL
jgi:integrase